MSLAGPRYVRFESIVWLKQKVLLEVHKVKRWKVKKDIDAMLGIEPNSLDHD